MWPASKTVKLVLQPHKWGPQARPCLPEDLEWYHHATNYSTRNVQLINKLWLLTAGTIIKTQTPPAFIIGLNPIKDVDRLLQCEQMMLCKLWRHKLYTSHHNTCEQQMTWSYLILFIHVHSSMVSMHGSTPQQMWKIIILQHSINLFLTKPAGAGNKSSRDQFATNVGSGA
jgi:hypothetical protein